MKMKTPLTNLMRTALTAAVMAYAAHPSLAQDEDPHYGKLVYRNMCDFLPPDAPSTFELMSNLPGLSRRAKAIKIPRGGKLIIDIPNYSLEAGDSVDFSLVDYPGHPYTLVLKFKIVSAFSGGDVVLVGMNGLEDMIYVDEDRKLHVKVFDTREGDFTSEPLEENHWLTLALAFGESECEISLNGNPLEIVGGQLEGSKADCYTARNELDPNLYDIYIGGGSPFFLADIRMYNGPVTAADELLGMGTPDDPFLISNANDWELLARTFEMGIQHGVPFNGNEHPYYCLTNNIGLTLPVVPQPVDENDHSLELEGFSPDEIGVGRITSPLGTQYNPFVGDFDGGSNFVIVVMGGSEYSEDPTAPFAYTGIATIHDFEVQGWISSTGDYTAGLIGTCLDRTWITDCEVQASVSGGSGHVGGIIGRIESPYIISLQRDVFSGTIESSGDHAGGLIGWCASNNDSLYVFDSLFSGSFRGTGKFHPILCKSENVFIGTYSRCENTYYDQACTPTEDADHVDSRFAGTRVSRSYVAGVWNQPVTAADGREWYKQAPSVSYSAWATANNIGAWNATDSNGIPNVFRFAFNKPTGAIANPPLLSISFNTNGNPVIHTPPVVYGDGFNLSILATDDLNGTGATTFSLVPSGETEIPATTAPARFFRLKAAEQ